MMLPAEITLLILLIFMAYQSIFGWMRDRAQQKQIDELSRAVFSLKKSIDEDIAHDLLELHERLKGIEPPRK